MVSRQVERDRPAGEVERSMVSTPTSAADSLMEMGARRIADDDVGASPAPPVSVSTPFSVVVVLSVRFRRSASAPPDIVMLITSVATSVSRCRCRRTS